MVYGIDTTLLAASLQNQVPLAPLGSPWRPWHHQVVGLPWTIFDLVGTKVRRTNLSSSYARGCIPGIVRGYEVLNPYCSWGYTIYIYIYIVVYMYIHNNMSVYIYITFNTYIYIYNLPRYLRISVFPIMQLNSTVTPLRICPHFVLMCFLPIWIINISPILQHKWT